LTFDVALIVSYQIRKQLNKLQLETKILLFFSIDNDSFTFYFRDNISFLVDIIKEKFSTPIQDEFCYWRHDTNILKKNHNNNNV